jgi:hypothetical protein
MRCALEYWLLTQQAMRFAEMILLLYPVTRQFSAYNGKAMSALTSSSTRVSNAGANLLSGCDGMVQNIEIVPDLGTPGGRVGMADMKHKN